MVGVTGQVQQVAGSVVQRVRQRDGQGHKPGIRTGEVSRGQNQAGSATRQEQERRFTRYRAQEKHTPRQSLQVWPSLKYTSIISSRCLTGCKVESLIAGSTRWPALVLQLIRQVSPTIAGQSIPDTKILLIWLYFTTKIL
ncbi:unnamed protein product, partial [Staurois parvus]